MKIKLYKDFICESIMKLDDDGNYYPSYEDEFPLTRDQVKSRLDYNWSIDGTYKINDDLTIDVDGGVKWNMSNHRNLPVKFNKVSGFFNISNHKLTSLIGSPKECGSFNCIDNNLKNLEGSPEIVKLNFYCGENPFTNLIGAPKSIGDRIYITSIKDSSSPLNKLLIGLPYTLNIEKIIGGISNELKLHWIDYLWDNNLINPNHIEWIKEKKSQIRRNIFINNQWFLDKHSWIFDFQHYTKLL